MSRKSIKISISISELGSKKNITGSSSVSENLSLSDTLKEIFAVALKAADNLTREKWDKS